jgi:hypothetical protein
MIPVEKIEIIENYVFLLDSNDTDRKFLTYLVTARSQIHIYHKLKRKNLKKALSETLHQHINF